ALVLAQPKIPKNPPKPPPPPVTKLEMTYSTGDVELWQTSQTIDSARSYTFRWQTTGVGITSLTSVQWRVLEQTSLKGLGSGTLKGNFAAGSYYRFPIELKPILPAQPPATPKVYRVIVVPRANGQDLPASSFVTLTYAKPDGYVTNFDDITLTQEIDRFEAN